MVLLGFWARLGALALLTFTVIATLLAHGSRGLTGEKRQQRPLVDLGQLGKCPARCSALAVMRRDRRFERPCTAIVQEACAAIQAASPERSRAHLARLGIAFGDTVAELAHVVQQEVGVRSVALLGERRDGAGPRAQAAGVAAVAADRREQLVTPASLGPDVKVNDWTRTNRNWFDAVQIEKRLMAIILMLVVAVAAFNLVSTLVMTVTDKQADIAILRTLGASPRSVMQVFLVQGAAAGVLGTIAGAVIGAIVAFNIDVIVPAIERVLGIAFLPGNIYLISRMPSDPRWADIVPITIVSLVLAFVATLYPSWRAAKVNPAEALRYE